MHPVITILGLIVWSGFRSRGSPEVLVASAGVVGVALAVSGRASFDLACRLVLRLRWLLFSIVMLFKRVRIPDLGSPSFLQRGVLGGVLALLLALQNGL